MSSLIKILTFLLLVAFATESFSSLWIKADSSIVMTEKEEKDSKETEKEDAKDKLNQCSTAIQIELDNKQLFVLSHTYFKYSAYLSLPEIPPKLS
jgi:hypothetical protein